MLLSVRRVHLEAAEDHVERLAHERDPIGAIKELVWNALDADATRVEVVLDRSDLGAVEKVTVMDNGTGIPPEGCVPAFERIGGSWKKMTRRTLKLNRFLHGNAGQGRLRGYALGRQIRWTTVADGIDGRQRTGIKASATARNDLDIFPSEPTEDKTGTVFEAWGLQSKQLDQLKSPKAISQLTTELATYLTRPDLARAAVAALTTYLGVLIARKRAAPDDDLVSAMSTARDGEPEWLRSFRTHGMRTLPVTF